jgi:C_GCAxxG_C_C family probable redox protein
MMQSENIQEVCDRAVELFNSGWNCAEAVFIAISENYMSTHDIPTNLVTGLGGGLGHRGLVCGALTGAIVSVGIVYGRKEKNQVAKEKTYEVVKDIVERFKREFGSVDCNQLSSNTKDIMEKKHICSKYVREATRLIATAVLNKD